MDIYNYAIELAREIVKLKGEIVDKLYDYQIKCYSKDTEFVQYKDDYIGIIAGRNTKSLNVEIFKPLTSVSSNPIIFVDDEGKCFRNHGERSSFCMYAELFMKKDRQIFFNEWSKKHQEEIENLFMNL